VVEDHEAGTGRALVHGTDEVGHESLLCVGEGS
jgi:hypothetical protein